MPNYAYEALDTGGKTVKGTIEAPNEEVIYEKLRDMGFYPLKIAQSKGSAGDLDLASLPGLKQVLHRVTHKHIAAFTRQLATLIDAGLPILRCLHILQDQSESLIFKEKIQQMTHDIESGASLSEALAKHPRQFDSLYVNMVRAGEMGGVLESVLNKIADFMEKRSAIISRVRSAMMYPLVVMVVAGSVVMFILIFIMPKFADIYGQLGADLPGLTQALIDMSDVIIHKWYLPIALIAGIVILMKMIKKSRTGRLYLDRIKLRLPVFGNLFRKVAIVRFSDTLATLITSGVPILQSLDIVRETSGNEVISRAMDGVYGSVKEGESIHEPLADAKVFPPLVVHMVAVGEETGAIDQMLVKVAEAYGREVDDTVEALASILEPLMIVFLGLIIGVIVIALYLPLFNIANVMK